MRIIKLCIVLFILICGFLILVSPAYALLNSDNFNISNMPAWNSRAIIFIETFNNGNVFLMDNITNWYIYSPSGSLLNSGVLTTSIWPGSVNGGPSYIDFFKNNNNQMVVSYRNNQGTGTRSFVVFINENGTVSHNAFSTFVGKPTVAQFSNGDYLIFDGNGTNYIWQRRNSSFQLVSSGTLGSLGNRPLKSISLGDRILVVSDMGNWFMLDNSPTPQILAQGMWTDRISGADITILTATRLNNGNYFLGGFRRYQIVSPNGTILSNVSLSDTITCSMSLENGNVLYGANLVSYDSGSQDFIFANPRYVIINENGAQVRNQVLNATNNPRFIGGISRLNNGNLVFGGVFNTRTFAITNYSIPTQSISNVNINSATITIANSATNKLDSYFTQVDVSPAFSDPIVIRNWGSGNSFNATGLTPNTTYFVRTRGANQHHSVRTAYSSNASFVTLANVPSLTLGTATGNSMAITINTNSNPSGTQYYVERATNSSFTSGVVVVNNWTTSTSINATGLNPGTVYYFRVKARNSNNVETGWSSIVNKVTAPPVPAVPTIANSGGLDWSNTAGRGFVVLSWSPVTNATGYNVAVFDGISYRKFDVGNTTTWDSRIGRIYPTEATLDGFGINSRNTDVFFYNQGGLDLRDNPNRLYLSATETIYNSATNYWFSITAYNTSGVSGLSDSRTITLPNRTDTIAPTINSIVVNDGNVRTGSLSVPISINGSDSQSGLREVLYSFDNFVTSTMLSWSVMGQTSGIMNFNVDIPPGEGNKAIHFRLVDVAGNISNTVVGNIFLADDNRPPSVNVAINSRETVTTNPNLEIFIEAYDDYSTVVDMDMRFSTDGRTWTPWESFDFIKNLTVSSTEGIKRVFVQVRDAMGNIGNGYSSIHLTTEENLQREQLRARQQTDTIPPTIEQFGLLGGATIARNSTVTFSLTVKDNTSLPHNISIELSTDGYNWIPKGKYSGNLTHNFGQAGFKEVRLKAIDETGNYTIRTLRFFILQ